MSQVKAAPPPKKLEFTTAVSFGGQYYVNPPPEGRSRVNKHELSAFMGFKRDIALATKIRAKFQLEFRFLNFSLEIPEVFKTPNSTALSTGVWFRFSTPREPSDEAKKTLPQGAQEKSYGRWGIIPWVQAGTVLRNFDVATNVEAGIPEGTTPTPQECENVGKDNPINPGNQNCEPNQAGTLVAYQGQRRWGADLITGLNLGFKALPRKPGKDLLNFNAEARLRGQVAPEALPRLSLRILLGASTVIHPKIAKFANLALRGGPEINLMDKRVDWYIMASIQFFLKTKPEGF